MTRAAAPPNPEPRVAPAMTAKIIIIVIMIIIIILLLKVKDDDTEHDGNNTRKHVPAQDDCSPSG